MVPMSAEREHARLWTAANVVTCLRVAGVPVWLAVAKLLPVGDSTSFSPGAFVTLALFAILSLTDSLDGYLARSRGEVTDFGKFLDPIADKLVVIVALCFLLEEGLSDSWVLLIVVSRELLVSGLRMVVSAQGEVIAASHLGKAKTATTMVAICLLLLARALPLGSAHEAALLLGNVSLWAAMALTLWSGFDYFAKSWPYLAGS